MEVCSDFIQGDPRKAWDGLKKLTESFSSSSSSTINSSSSNVLKDRNGKLLCTPQDLVDRFGEHYEALASDITGHSLDQQYWQECLGPPPLDTIEWNINGPITMDEIQKAVRSMQCNKAPGPDGLPIEFYKAFFETNVDPTTDPTTDPTVDPTVDPTIDPGDPGNPGEPGNPDIDPGYPGEPGEPGKPGIDPGSIDDSSYSDCAKCLLILFNKIWNGDFPSDWNTASIISIPKKGDLTDCSNYRGISLINIGLKLLSKIVTDRISSYAFQHHIIRPEQYGFRNNEESISLYISIREICQRRRMNGDHTYLAFLDLKKAYDSVPIYNILTKLYNMGIRGNTYTFLTNLYLTSKAHATHHGNQSKDFPVHRGVRQGCPLSPILFDLFINDILQGCDQYGVDVNANGLKCCGSLFADDIVLIAPSQMAMDHLLERVQAWALKNEMAFGINKCATLVVKPLSVDPTLDPQPLGVDPTLDPKPLGVDPTLDPKPLGVDPTLDPKPLGVDPTLDPKPLGVDPMLDPKPLTDHDPDPTFYLGTEPLPQTPSYTYLGVPFDENLSLDPILSNLNQQLEGTLRSLDPFLINKSVPLVLKKLVLDAFVLSHVQYIAPLLGFDPIRSSRAQSIINKSLYRCLGIQLDLDPSSINTSTSNSNMNLYSLWQEFRMNSLSAICALAQRHSFKKWMSSSCVIGSLVHHVPNMSNMSNRTTLHSWSQESQVLDQQLQTMKTPQAIKEYYDLLDHTPRPLNDKTLDRTIDSTSARTMDRSMNKITARAPAKANMYLKYQYGFFKTIQEISLRYPEYQLGFYWISRIRCGFKLDTRVAIERRMVSNQCPTTCPCCGEGSQSFTHWILRCKVFKEARAQHLPFLDELYAWLTRIINQTSLEVTRESESDYEDNINYLLLNVLLGGHAVYRLLHVNSTDRKHILDGLFNKSSMGTDPYFVGLAAYLTSTITRITRSFALLFEWYGKSAAVAGCVDVETIRPNEWRPSVVTSDTTGSMDSHSTTTSTIEECESIEAYFTSSYLM